MFPENKWCLAPHNCFLELGVAGRCLAVVAFVSSTAVVALFALHGTIDLIEIISAYLTLIFMLWLSMLDAKKFILPNSILLMWLKCRIILMVIRVLIFGFQIYFVYSIFGALIIGLFFLIAHYLSGYTLGGGDVKLSFILGLSLGFPLILSATFFGFMICGILSLIGLVLKRVSNKSSIPLCPFMMAGTLIAYLFQII